MRRPLSSPVFYLLLGSRISTNILPNYRMHRSAGYSSPVLEHYLVNYWVGAGAIPMTAFSRVGYSRCKLWWVCAARCNIAIWVIG